MSDRLTDVLEGLCDPSLSLRLADCPADTPLPYQLDIVREAQRRAERAGLRLPTITWKWVDGARSEHLPRGTMYPGSGPGVTIYLRTDRFPEDLARTAAHELKHAADSALIRNHCYPKEDFEQRADAFADRLMAKWPWFR